MIFPTSVAAAYQRVQREYDESRQKKKNSSHLESHEICHVGLQNVHILDSALESNQPLGGALGTDEGEDGVCGIRALA